MGSSSPIEELDSCEYLFLESISEPRINGLRLVLGEGIVSPNKETFAAGTIEIADTRAVEVTAASRHFEVVWNSYITFVIRNESYCTWDSDEAWKGKSFRVYSKSKFLDFVDTATFANAKYPGPFSHFELLCCDHIIDVASEQGPSVRRVGA